MVYNTGRVERRTFLQPASAEAAPRPDRLGDASRVLAPDDGLLLGRDGGIRLFPTWPKNVAARFEQSARCWDGLTE